MEREGKERKGQITRSRGRMYMSDSKGSRFRISRSGKRMVRRVRVYGLIVFR